MGLRARSAIWMETTIPLKVKLQIRVTEDLLREVYPTRR